jgi:hypothetical protein
MGESGDEAASEKSGHVAACREWTSGQIAAVTHAHKAYTLWRDRNRVTSCPWKSRSSFIGDPDARFS